MPVTIELYPHEVTVILQALAQTSTNEEDEHHGKPIFP